MLPTLLMAFGVTAAAVQASVFRGVQAKVYAELFRQQSELRFHSAAAREPRIVCGMTLIPADPNIDPQIRIVVPSTPEHKIQALRPPVCVE